MTSLIAEDVTMCRCFDVFDCRGADNVQVIYWYHRQFIETATERYLHDDAFSKQCHLHIAHYFMSTWAGEANNVQGYLHKHR